MNLDSYLIAANSSCYLIFKPAASCVPFRRFHSSCKCIQNQGCLYSNFIPRRCRSRVWMYRVEISCSAHVCTYSTHTDNSAVYCYMLDQSWLGGSEPALNVRFPCLDCSEQLDSSNLRILAIYNLVNLAHQLPFLYVWSIKLLDFQIFVDKSPVCPEKRVSVCSSYQIHAL